MSYKTYCKLIDGLCKMVGFSDPESLYERAEMSIDYEDCVLMHGGPHNEDGLAVFCIYGRPPEKDTDLVLQRLLEANLTFMPPGGLRFAIDPATDEVMVGGVVPMSGLEPEKLLALLVELANQAKDWREHHFLGTANEPGRRGFSPMSATAKARGRLT